MDRNQGFIEKLIFMAQLEVSLKGIRNEGIMSVSVDFKSDGSNHEKKKHYVRLLKFLIVANEISLQVCTKFEILLLSG